MKCIASNPEVDRCDRCVRLQRDCEYEPHRRGLWRRERLDKGYIQDLEIAAQPALCFLY
jgi:hypothetical protein